MNILPKQPLLSIVIANYNYGRFLEEAIQSVLRQCDEDMRLPTGEQIELIIVDGGSTDNSVDIIQAFSDRLGGVRFLESTDVGEEVTANSANLANVSGGAKVCEAETGKGAHDNTKTIESPNSRTRFLWCSEKDRGQSHAFNKGFTHATGRFLTWLNADDILLPGTLEVLKHASDRHPECEWFTGNYLQFDQDTRKIIFAPWGAHILPTFLQTFDSPLVIFGPTTFWSRQAYFKIGDIDESLHYSMDTDYWLRMKKNGYRQHRLNHCCWAFRMHDSSKTAQYGARQIEEKVRARWYEELSLVNHKVGYQCSRPRRLLGFVMRFLDFSFLIAVYRRLFIVGNTLENYLRISNDSSTATPLKGKRT